MALGLHEKNLLPGASDILSRRGVRQAKQIAADQLSYYKKNPIFAAAQAWEATTNLLVIIRKVEQYCLKYGTDPKQVMKLIKEWVFQ